MVTKKEMASASESDEATDEEQAKKKSEPVVKTPEKSGKGKAAAGNLNAASKKQASIMNFFKKK